MLANLKSLLSNHVAPGGAIASASPFSFFARVEAYGSTGEDAKRIDAIRERLSDVMELLDADHLIRGRDALRAIIQDIEK